MVSWDSKTVSVNQEPTIHYFTAIEWSDAGFGGILALNTTHLPKRWQRSRWLNARKYIVRIGVSSKHCTLRQLWITPIRSISMTTDESFWGGSSWNATFTRICLAFVIWRCYPSLSWDPLHERCDLYNPYHRWKVRCRWSFLGKAVATDDAGGTSCSLHFGSCRGNQINLGSYQRSLAIYFMVGFFKLWLPIKEDWDKWIQDSLWHQALYVKHCNILQWNVTRVFNTGSFNMREL